MASGLGSPWDGSHLRLDKSDLVYPGHCQDTSSDAVRRLLKRGFSFGNIFGHGWESAPNIALVAIESICAAVLIYCFFTARGLKWTHKGVKDKLRTVSLSVGIFSSLMAVLTALSLIVVNQQFTCTLKTYYTYLYALFALFWRSAEMIIIAVVARTVIEQLRFAEYQPTTTNVLKKVFYFWAIFITLPNITSFVLYILWMVKIYLKEKIPFSVANYGEAAAKLDVGYHALYLVLALAFMAALALSFQQGAVPTTKSRRVLLWLVTVPLVLRSIEQVIISSLIAFTALAGGSGSAIIGLADAIVYDITTTWLFFALIRLGKLEQPVIGQGQDDSNLESNADYKVEDTNQYGEFQNNYQYGQPQNTYQYEAPQTPLQYSQAQTSHQYGEYIYPPEEKDKLQPVVTEVPLSPQSGTQTNAPHF